MGDVLFFGSIREDFGYKEPNVPGNTVGQVLKNVENRHREKIPADVKIYRDGTNQQITDLKEPLKPNDILAIYSLLS